MYALTCFPFMCNWVVCSCSKPKLYAGELLDLAASHFSLKEKEYFGLHFNDSL